MRIFRMRRGFTTNSSSANDWIPTTGGSKPTARETLGHNILTALGVVFFVVLMFLVEKVIKKFYKKWKDED